MKKLLTLLLLVSTASFVFSQTQFSGQIIDAHSKIPIEGAHIYFKNIPYGTISNAEGRFEIFLKTEGRDSVIISHVNYEQKTFPQAYFSKANALVLLNISIANLSDVVLTPLDPDKILQDVLDNFDDNYYPVSYQGVIKQTAYFDGDIKRFLMADVIVKESKKRNYLNKVYLESDSYCKKQSKDYDERIMNLTDIIQLVSFTDLKSWIVRFKEKKGEFDEVYVNQGNYGAYQTFEVHLIQHLTEEKESSVNIIIDKESKAVLAIELKGDRGDGVDKWHTFYESEDEKIAAIHTSGYVFIKYRPYKDKWMLSEIKAEGTASFLYKNKEGYKNYKYNLNKTHIVINSLTEKKGKKKYGIKLNKDLFNQIEFTQNYKVPTGITLTKEEQNFAEKIVDL